MQLFSAGISQIVPSPLEPVSLFIIFAIKVGKIYCYDYFEVSGKRVVSLYAMPLNYLGTRKQESVV